MYKTQMKFLLQEDKLPSNGDFIIHDESVNKYFKCKYNVTNKKKINNFDLYEDLMNNEYQLVQLDNIQVENFFFRVAPELLRLLSKKRVLDKPMFHYEIAINNIEEISDKDFNLIKETLKEEE